MQWLLYLSCEDEPEVVVLATKILARLLVVHGSGYSKKFSDKNGGYTILEHHLKRWWNVPALWTICFSILFGRDIALLDHDKPFDSPGLLKLFLSDGDLRIVNPEIFPVITGMLKSGLSSIASRSDFDAQSGTDMPNSELKSFNMLSVNFNGMFLQIS